MIVWIEYPPEPKELLLVWQAPASVPDRLRWAVGRLFRAGEEYAFDYLEGAEFSAINVGRTLDELKAAGFSGYPAFQRDKRPPEGFRTLVLEAFLRRVPPQRRPDFTAYLSHYHVKPAAKLSPLALLSVTEARLPSDGFSLVDPLDPASTCVDVPFEIAGFRHIGQEGQQAEIGSRLELRSEPAISETRQLSR